MQFVWRQRAKGQNSRKYAADCPSGLPRPLHKTGPQGLAPRDEATPRHSIGLNSCLAAIRDLLWQ